MDNGERFPRSGPDVEGESLLHASTSVNNEAYTDERPEPGSSPLCIGTFIILPAIVGMLFFGAYVVYNKQINNSSYTKPHTGEKSLVAPTILISIDGFRYDYLNRTTDGKVNNNDNTSYTMLAPTLRKLSLRGVIALPGMQPIMPTVTFPNHWTIVTGLYAESHGIVGNTMYSPVTDTWFHYNGSDPHWWAGEPIWQTLQRTPRYKVLNNGTKMPYGDNFTTASVFWVGSDVLKHAPDAFWKYDASVTYDQRIDRAISLLTGNTEDLQKRADFVTLYFDSVDRAGHAHGPDSQQVNDEIQRVDNAIASLLSKLEEAFGNDFNIIVVSDHGMTEVDDSRVIDLSADVPNGTVQDVEVTPVGMWLNVSDSVEGVYERIRKSIESSGNHADIYKKSELPERWHLSKSIFVTPVVTVAELGWTVKYPHQNLMTGVPTRITGSAEAPESSRFKQGRENEHGTHGFDNENIEMYALFIAAGPAFQVGKTVSGFRNLDVYPMICRMFGAVPAPNNGSVDISDSYILA